MAAGISDRSVRETAGGSLAVVRSYVFQIQIYRSRLAVTRSGKLPPESDDFFNVSSEKRSDLVTVDRHQRSHLLLNIFEKRDFSRAVLLRH